MSRRRGVAVLIAVLAAGAAGCTGATADPPAPPATAPPTSERTPATSPVTGETRGLTRATALSPLLVSSSFPAVPVTGSEGTVLTTFEVAVTNATPLTLTLSNVTVSAPSGTVLQTLDAAAIPAALGTAGARQGNSQLTNSQHGTLFLTVESPDRAAVPERLLVAVTVDAPELPGGSATSVPVAVPVSALTPPVLGPPLEPGVGYFAGDSCCDPVRHRRAELAIDGRSWLVQRFAVDWEQLDPRGRTTIADDILKPESYTIFGKQTIAAADGTVVHLVDGLGEQVPGTYPKNISLAEADGNSVVVDIGGGLYLLYAHMQPGSLVVREGQQLRKGDPIGRVGNTGNSVAPHLHFQVMDGPSPLAAEGVPYVIDRFTVTGRIPSTEVFDEFERSTSPMPVDPTPFAGEHQSQLPLDRYVVTFP